MEMHQVRYFLAVADLLNFTRAAESCNVSQPSLTRAVKLLEDEFGGPLFHRERANTHLSELGRQVHGHLKHVHEQSLAAKLLAKDFAKLKKTVLKLGIMCTIAPNRVVEMLGTIQARHPGVEIDVVDASARELNDRLFDGDLEVALYCLPADEADERIHATQVFREQMVIVVAPGHKFAEGNSVSVRQLDGERYVNRAKCEFRGYAAQVFAEHGVHVETVYRGERDDWVLAMIAAGQGFGFMPESVVNHAGVVTRPLVDPEFWREVNLVTVRGRPHSPAVATLVKQVAQGGLKAEAS